MALFLSEEIMERTQTKLKMLEFIKNDYSDKKFFTSKYFRERVENLAKMVANRFKDSKNYRRIRTELFWGSGS